MDNKYKLIIFFTFDYIPDDVKNINMLKFSLKTIQRELINDKLDNKLDIKVQIYTCTHTALSDKLKDYQYAEVIDLNKMDIFGTFPKNESINRCLHTIDCLDVRIFESKTSHSRLFIIKHLLATNYNILYMDNDTGFIKGCGSAFIQSLIQHDLPALYREENKIPLIKYTQTLYQWFGTYMLMGSTKNEHEQALDYNVDSLSTTVFLKRFVDNHIYIAENNNRLNDNLHTVIMRTKMFFHLQDFLNRLNINYAENNILNNGMIYFPIANQANMTIIDEIINVYLKLIERFGYGYGHDQLSFNIIFYKYNLTEQLYDITNGNVYHYFIEKYGHPELFEMMFSEVPSMFDKRFYNLDFEHFIKLFN
jgi:hypothetical protein